MFFLCLSFFFHLTIHTNTGIEKKNKELFHGTHQTTHLFKPFRMVQHTNPQQWITTGTPHNSRFWSLTLWMPRNKCTCPLFWGLDPQRRVIWVPGNILRCRVSPGFPSLKLTAISPLKLGFFPQQKETSWWFQPIWKIWYRQIGSSPPGFGLKIKKIFELPPP